MKYMGSKRILLRNGLGKLIRSESESAQRIVDLFSGAGHVAHFAATQTQLPVIAVDLQRYSKVLAAAVIERTKPVDHQAAQRSWLYRAAKRVKATKLWKEAKAIEGGKAFTEVVQTSRRFCDTAPAFGPVVKAYGGYYFSPSQALLLDYMLDSLPTAQSLRQVCLATTLCVASRCAAAPGHTAQPFRPTQTSEVYLQEAWSRDPLALANQYLETFCKNHANRRGRAITGDALIYSKSVRSDDLVFVDPPYSDVQYSRFYHVLETVAAGFCGQVSGAGRYPPVSERPQSDFSKKSASLPAATELLGNLGQSRCTVILTFPANRSSNGISGSDIEDLARQDFEVASSRVEGIFSTLGGNKGHRQPIQRSEELILLLRPKKRS